ncbi:MAG: Gfo/Idh/MocA family oxidoreductase [Planctomycetaceae bacterium]|nr:Gfo/Idh/MocA family oxidoreductase [Planctomycetaceae bacterium]
MKIGIIGAENSHTTRIAHTINVEKLIKGFTVDYVWGETDEYAQKAAKEGKIPNMVKRPIEMLGKIDALIVDHRHGKYHLKSALPFVKKGIPCFIDKPFCYRYAEGKEFLKIAKKYGTPVTSFSVIPKQKTFIEFTKKLFNNGDVLAGTMYGPADLKSKWGGVFFYGIHQVDAALNVFGYNVVKVLITKNGNGSTGQMIYSDGKIVTLNLVKQGHHGFFIDAMCTKGFIQQTIVYDENPYLNGIKTFTKMFKSGIEPEKYENILKPVQVLEAMEKSIASGKIENVER